MAGKKKQDTKTINIVTEGGAVIGMADALADVIEVTAHQPEGAIAGAGIPELTLHADDQFDRFMLYALLRFVREFGPAERIAKIEHLAREFELYEEAHR